MKKQVLCISLCMFIIITIIPAGIILLSGKTYLALGDSITAGYGIEIPDDFFVNIFAKKHGYNVINEAKNGNTTRDIISQLESGTLNNVISSSSVITITCGGNDLMNLLCEKISAKYNKKYNTLITSENVADVILDSSDFRRLPLALTALNVLGGDEKNSEPAFADSTDFIKGLGVYIKNLNEIVSRIRCLNKNVKIVIMTQYNPYKTFSGALDSLSEGIDKGVRKLNYAIKLNSENSKKYIVADVYDYFENDSRELCFANAGTFNFDFHPNKTGHGVIAECMENIIFK